MKIVGIKPSPTGVKQKEKPNDHLTPSQAQNQKVRRHIPGHHHPQGIASHAQECVKAGKKGADIMTPRIWYDIRNKETGYVTFTSTEREEAQRRLGSCWPEDEWEVVKCVEELEGE